MIINVSVILTHKNWFIKQYYKVDKKKQYYRDLNCMYMILDKPYNQPLILRHMWLQTFKIKT